MLVKAMQLQILRSWGVKRAGDHRAGIAISRSCSQLFHIQIATAVERYKRILDDLVPKTLLKLRLGLDVHPIFGPSVLARQVLIGKVLH